MVCLLRALNLDTDAARYVALVNTVESEPTTVEREHERAQNFPTAGVRRLMVALDERGDIVGCSETVRRPNMAAGTWALGVIVAPESQRRGIGAQLYADASAFARARGATRLTCETREDLPNACRFAQARGFEMNRHIFESTLDLGSFDDTRFAGVIESVQAQGIRFFTLAEAGNTAANQRKLHALNRRAALDILGWEGEFPGFEDFSRYVFQASWFRAEGQIFAADGDRWVGLSAVGYFQKTNATYNMHTGVEQEYRGRHIALALKLLAIRYARQCGAAYIRTNNDSQNAPILAINRKLGYAPQPGWYRWVRVL